VAVAGGGFDRDENSSGADSSRINAETRKSAHRVTRPVAGSGASD
jgi:hypothetical protein